MAENNQDNISKRAKKYSNLKYAFLILDFFYLSAILLFFAASGLSRELAGKVLSLSIGFFTLPFYLFICFSGYSILSLPLSYYHGFFLEHKFHLSGQTLKDWLLDQLKSFAISYLILLILILAFYNILGCFYKLWWLVISFFWILFSLVLTKLTPVVIIPLFFKYKKLSEGALKIRILRLAEKMKIGPLDCFEINFSKKTFKANAAFVGWGKTRRVILADTLKDRYSEDEIEVILAHEFAHYKMRHLLKLILLNSSVTLLIFYIIYLSNSLVLDIFGFSSLSEIASLPIVFLYFILFGLFTHPLENLFSRQMEKNADMQALKITNLRDAFISLMGKLSTQNLADRCPHPAIKFFFFDHPPIEERIAMAKTMPEN